MATNPDTLKTWIGNAEADPAYAKPDQVTRWRQQLEQIEVDQEQPTLFGDNGQEAECSTSSFDEVKTVPTPGNFRVFARRLLELVQDDDQPGVEMQAEFVRATLADLPNAMQVDAVGVIRTAMAGEPSGAVVCTLLAIEPPTHGDECAELLNGVNRELLADILATDGTVRDDKVATLLDAIALMSPVERDRWRQELDDHNLLQPKTFDAEMARRLPQAATVLTADGVPELPENAKLPDDLGLAACQWLDDYIEFSRRWSPRSFDGFHVASGLWVLSTVAARRVVVHFGKPRFTNLYFLLCGRTTIHAKSSATDVGRQTLTTCGLRFLLASDEATPQSFIRSLAKRQLPHGFDDLPEEVQAAVRMRLAFNAQRGWYHEEFGSGLASMMRTDGVMADFRGLLRKFDDTPSQYSRETIARGVERVEMPYLALIANATPADLKPLAKKGTALWGDGFLARFVLVAPPTDEVLTGRFPKGIRDIPPRLSTPLVEWHKRLGIPDVHIQDETSDDGRPTGKKRVEVDPLQVTVLKISSETWDAYYRYDHAMLDIARSSDRMDLDGNYGRLAEKALRVATLFASFGASDAVELNHWARAQEIVECWRTYAHRLYDQVTRLDVSEEREIEDKILDALRRWQGTDKYPDGMTANEISKFVYGLGTSEVKILADQLYGAGVLYRWKPKRSDRYLILGVNGLGKADE